jgi:hypothetical protein
MLSSTCSGKKLVIRRQLKHKFKNELCHFLTLVAFGKSIYFPTLTAWSFFKSWLVQEGREEGCWLGPLCLALPLPPPKVSMLPLGILRRGEAKIRQPPINGGS